MNSGCFPSGLFMLDRLSHLKGGVPVGGGGLLPAWHYINYIVYFFHPVRRPPPLRSSPFQAGQSIRLLLHQHLDFVLVLHARQSSSKLGFTLT